MPTLKPGTILPSEKEERKIIRQAEKDKTLLSDKQLSDMKPVSEFSKLKKLVKRGRPPKKNPKQSTTIRLNADVLLFFKTRGKGWQTEINNVLQKHVDSHA
jgi:uncharacterized protein (DUF4415 family)